MNARYKTEEFTREISAEVYLAKYHNPDKVWEYCHACKNYGKQWSCPPFDFDVVERLSKYRNIRLIATKLILLDKCVLPCELPDLLQPERVRLEEQLLALERQYNGLACTYISECQHCAKGACARLKGKPCCHPELVRPSLEAYGFDVARTMTDIFDIELKWSANNALPEYILLVCALFYNAE